MSNIRNRSGFHPGLFLAVTRGIAAFGEVMAKAGVDIPAAGEAAP